MTHLLAIGTKKGLFLATSADRRSWEITGPVAYRDDDEFLSSVYAIGIDTRRATPRLLVSADSSHFGPTVWTSDDLGRSWTEPKESAPIVFPSWTEAALTRVWQFSFGNDETTVYAGVEPTALFVSNNGGHTFELNEALWKHPHRQHWYPGFGGAAVHTVLPHPRDPESLTIAMSTGGVYTSADAGLSWTPANKGIQAGFQPDRFPEYGQCVHKVVRDATVESRLFAQNHDGVYRTDNGGTEWVSIAAGLPSDFGFAMLAHPHNPDTVLVFPVESSGKRFPAGERLQVHRSDDGGTRWRSVSNGLPTGPYYGIVLRDAACTDQEPEPGWYFGTRTGDVYCAIGDDHQWDLLVAHLPDVLCVRAATV